MSLSLPHLTLTTHTTLTHIITYLSDDLSNAQDVPRQLQLRSVGSRLFTKRGPITTKVLRELCVKIKCERDGLELLGSAANKQFAAPVQTGGKRQFIAKKTKARLPKLCERCEQSAVCRLACDQNDHVSFARAWMLLSKAVAHSHQCELDTGLRQTLETVVVGRITVLASEHAKLPTCHGGL